jgi:hypothetical protein
MDDAVGRMERLGMVVQGTQVEPCRETRTLLGHARDYEGGFVLLRVCRQPGSAAGQDMGGADCT